MECPEEIVTSLLGRVPRSKVADLSPSDWSFYTAGDGLKDGSWTPKLDQARPVLSNPGRSSTTGMTYIESLHRYVLVTWHYHKANYQAAIEAKDLSTGLDFFEAPHPWGPWTKVKSFETGRLGWYSTSIGQRFQIAVSPDTVKVFLYATGFYTTPEGSPDLTGLYKLNYLPVTLSTTSLRHKNPAYVGGRD